MHVIVLTKSLSAALRTVKPAVPRSGSLPVLQHARLDAHDGALTLTTTDLDLTITTPVTADVRLDGSTTAHVGELTIAAKGKGSTELVHEDGRVRATNGVTTLLPAMPDDFPATIGREGPAVAEFDLDVAVVRSVITAVSADLARPILTGVYFDPNGSLVGTDSYRLHLVTNAHTSPGMLMPARALTAVLGHVKSGTVAVEQYDRTARLAAADGTTWTTQSIEGEFPNYTQLIPVAPPHQLRFPRPAFTDAVASIAQAIRKDQGEALTIDQDDDRLRLSTKAGNVTVNLPGSSPVRLALNPVYLLDLLDGLSTCTLNLTDALKPVMVTERIGDHAHTRIQMPCK